MSKGLKRSAPPSKGSSKKRKVASKPSGSSHSSTKASKLKVKDKTTIPIPTSTGDDEEDLELSDQDYEIGESLQAASFLTHLDKTGLARSKKETERLHKLDKPKRLKAHRDDDLPSIDSHSEDDGVWSSGLEDDILSDTADDPGSEGSISDSSSVSFDEFGDSDAEMPYEALPRPGRAQSTKEDDGISRLPIKLASGQVKKSKEKVLVNMDTREDSEEDEEDTPKAPTPPPRDDVATGARFGRPAVVDVVGKGSRKTRVKAAQEQIASICQDILADPENSLGLLRRLHTFSLASISTATNPEPVQNDVVIRRLAMLSQLAVFKDLIPGYRIRSLTDKEKAEKVSQAVSRTREWEQGLVGVYQNYLCGCEDELKAKTELADTALRCMCTLLQEVTHFNFRTNILASVIGRLSKKKWDDSSELCLTTLNAVFRADVDGQVSLETVRLLNRMIKERRFSVDPAVLSCLLHLRVHKESQTRVSEQRADKHVPDKARGKGKSKRDKIGAPTHLSKKTKKMLKERKEIEGEMQEAAAEIDLEEKATAHTETLKLLFVLYFRILKNDRPTPLLSAALQGISRYAHNVNVDFFRDLLAVLKAHVAGTHWKAEVEQDGRTGTGTSTTDQVRVRLECIVTAYELLTGQGEALDLDLSEFLRGLYALLLPLSANASFDQAVFNAAGVKQRSTADLLFRALDLSLNVQPRSAAGGAAPAARQAAFARRLLECALEWPGPVAAQAVRFVRGLVVRDKRLLALLDGDELAAEGIWRPDLDDPDLANALAGPAWEVVVLKEKHVDESVRKAASALVALTREPQ